MDFRMKMYNGAAQHDASAEGIVWAVTMSQGSTQERRHTKYGETALDTALEFGKSDSTLANLNCFFRLGPFVLHLVLLFQAGVTDGCDRSKGNLLYTVAAKGMDMDL
ncbi:hypothetical protein Tco_1344632 [Tanacetum coccineum]